MLGEGSERSWKEWSKPRSGDLIYSRNRILHMAYLWKPNDAPSVLNPRQALDLAKLATKTASEYVASLSEAFDEIQLPIRTIRSVELCGEF